MQTDTITFLMSVAIVVVWWFAVLAVAGNRFGMFHWMPVAMAAFGIPMAITDITYQQPQVSEWFSYGWNSMGLVLASLYFAHRRTRHHTPL